MTNETSLRDTLQRAAESIPGDETNLDDIVHRGRRRRTRGRAAAIATVAVVAIAVGIGGSTIELSSSPEFADDADVEVEDLPAAPIETGTLDGRILELTAPDGIVGPEPTGQTLRLASDTVGITVVASAAELPDTPGDAELELVEDRWEGEIRVASTPEGVPTAVYDDGEQQLTVVADRGGPDLLPVESIDELLAAFDRIDVARTATGLTVTPLDDELDAAWAATYPVAGIDAELRVFEDSELIFESEIQPIEEPREVASGELIIGEDGLYDLVTPDLIVRIELVLADETEQRRAIELLTDLGVELGG